MRDALLIISSFGLGAAVSGLYAVTLVIRGLSKVLRELSEVK